MLLLDAGILGEPLDAARHRSRRDRRGRRRAGRGARRRATTAARRSTRWRAARPIVVARLHAEGRLDGILGLGGSGNSTIIAAGHARAAGRRPEAARLDGRLGRHAAVRRRGRHRDDVLGRRHRRHQPHLRADHDQRRGDDRRRRQGPRSRPRRRAAADRRQHVRRHDALRDRARASASRSSATRCSCSTRRARAGSRWRRSRARATSRACSTRRPRSSPTSSSAACSRPGPIGSRPRASAGCRRSCRSARSTWSTSARARSVPARFDDRNLYVHNATVTLMRTTPQECLELGRQIGRKLSAARGRSCSSSRCRGVSAIAVEGQVFHDAEADAALLRGLDETLSRDDRAARPRYRHQRSGLRARDGRSTARADQGDTDDEGRGARATASAARGGQPDHRRRRRHRPLGEVRRGRRHRPHHHLQLGPLPHGRTRLAVRDDALRRRERDRRRHGARGAAGRARDAGAGGRLRHRPVPPDARVPRRAQAHRLQRRPELPDRRPDRRHAARRASRRPAWATASRST